jgi:hypothetical protein
MSVCLNLSFNDLTYQRTCIRPAKTRSGDTCISTRLFHAGTDRVNQKAVQLAAERETQRAQSNGVNNLISITFSWVWVSLSSFHY